MVSVLLARKVPIRAAQAPPHAHRVQKVRIRVLGLPSVLPVREVHMRLVRRVLSAVIVQRVHTQEMELPHVPCVMWVPINPFKAVKRAFRVQLVNICPQPQKNALHAFCAERVPTKARKGQHLVCSALMVNIPTLRVRQIVTHAPQVNE